MLFMGDSNQLGVISIIITHKLLGASFIDLINIH